MNFIMICIKLYEILGDNCCFVLDLDKRNVINGRSIIMAVPFMQDLCLRSKF